MEKEKTPPSKSVKQKNLCNLIYSYRQYLLFFAGNYKGAYHRKKVFKHAMLAAISLVQLEEIIEANILSPTENPSKERMTSATDSTDGSYRSTFLFGLPCKTPPLQLAIALSQLIHALMESLKQYSDPQIHILAEETYRHVSIMAKGIKQLKNTQSWPSIFPCSSCDDHE